MNGEGSACVQSVQGKRETEMRIQYLGHASFLLTTNAGTRIVTDPVDPDGYPGSLNYKKFNEPADIITVSHEHMDHFSLGVIEGSPIIIKGNGKFLAREVEFVGVETFHDESRGAQRGRNTVFVINVDDLIIAHMGDLGHVLTADQAAEIGAVDIALIPVGGYYTIDAKQAQKVAEQVEARVVIPMHYKTDSCNFPIEGVERFLNHKSNVRRLESSYLDVTKESLPQQQEIVVLEHAL